MDVVIIKYNAGNVQSVLYALERLNITASVSDNVEVIMNADKIIFPGVGEAGSAMRYLNERGLAPVIKNIRQPFLGICLGMQLMCNHSEEADTTCLGIFKSDVKKFDHHLKVPQVGWNDLQITNSPLLKNLSSNPYFYFVHSYYAGVTEETIAVTNYGIDFSSALQQDNFYGVQFHPEKSADDGAQLLKNFLDL